MLISDENMRNTFYQTFKTLVDLCFLRGSPVDLPYSYFWLGAFITIETVLNILSWNRLKGAPFSEILLASLLMIGLLTGIIYLLLAQRKMQQRFPKVMIAWLGTELLLELFLKLLLVILPNAVLTMQFQAGLVMVLLIWNVLIKAHIFKLSMQMKMISSILIIFGIMVASYMPVQLILSPYLPQLVESSR